MRKQRLFFHHTGITATKLCCSGLVLLQYWFLLFYRLSIGVISSESFTNLQVYVFNDPEAQEQLIHPIDFKEFIGCSGCNNEWTNGYKHLVSLMILSLLLTSKTAKGNKSCSHHALEDESEIPILSEYSQLSIEKFQQKRCGGVIESE